MRILLCSHGYPPTVSGVTKVVQKLGQALVRYGHQVCVVTASDRGRSYRSEDEGVNLIRVSSRANPVWSEGPMPMVSWRTLQRIINECRPDIIHTHDNGIFGSQLVHLRPHLDVPLVASCHILPKFTLSYLPDNILVEKIVSLVIWRYLVWQLNYFDAVVFPTEAQRACYLQRGLRTPSTAISNGVDVGRFYPNALQAQAYERKQNLPPRPRLLFVGRLCRDKRIDLLIRAMDQIRHEQSAHLLIAGRGDERSALESLADQLGLAGHVHFLGYVPDEDLPDLYRAADAFIIASPCEVQSIPTLEALVTGLPVIAVNAGALPELVLDGNNGYLVPSNDELALAQAIGHLLGQPDRAREFGEIGRQIGLKHAEVRTFKAFVNLYQQLLNSWYTPVSAIDRDWPRSPSTVRPTDLAPGHFQALGAPARR